MSADGSISLVWGDGEQTFRFAIGQFRELQENVNRRRLAIGAAPVGPMDLLNQLRANNAWPDDVRDVLRLGLIGAGMKPADAHRLMTHYFDDFAKYPPLENMKPAFVVLLAGLAGAPGDDVAGSKKKTTTTAAGRSASPPSTAPAPQ